MKITGSLCGLKREEIQDNLSDIEEIVKKPKYICGKCARVCNTKKHLCRPTKFPSKKK